MPLQGFVMGRDKNYDANITQ